MKEKPHSHPRSRSKRSSDGAPASFTHAERHQLVCFHGRSPHQRERPHSHLRSLGSGPVALHTLYKNHCGISDNRSATSLRRRGQRTDATRDTLDDCRRPSHRCTDHPSGQSTVGHHRMQDMPSSPRQRPSKGTPRAPLPGASAGHMLPLKIVTSTDPSKRLPEVPRIEECQRRTMRNFVAMPVVRSALKTTTPKTIGCQT